MLPVTRVDTEWWDGLSIMDWKGLRRKCSWRNIRFSGPFKKRKLLGGAE
jgi:hypothetical protein